MAKPVGLDRPGDSTASLAGLYREHYLRLVRLSVQFVDDQASAEDLVQEVFERLHRTRRDLAQLTDPRRYLTTAVVNQARSTLRHRKVVRLVRTKRLDNPVHAAPADTEVLRDATSELIWKAITRLPTRQRQVIVLRYYEDWSIPEIATTLRISRGAVSSSLNRALTSLALPIGAIHA